MERFNIRVYGILTREVNQQKEVLLSDEFRYEQHFTKFPGGGLELGEGIEDALIREFQEELGITIALEHLFYVNPFLQVSAFQKSDQLISIYYLVSHSGPDSKIINQNQEESFRWVPIHALNETTCTFPIDQAVVELLREKYQ